MAYTEQEVKRLQELYTLIESRKEHPNAAPTYKDSPALAETAQIILSRNDADIDTLVDKIAVLRYLCDSYYSLGRAAVSAKYYKIMLGCYLALKKLKSLNTKEQEAFEYAIFMAFKTRVYYEPDACKDLMDMLSGSVGQDKLSELYQNAANARRGLPKDDPVEQTEEYLAVIDEVERLIDENKTMDFCMEYWSLKSYYLSQKGIYWRSPVLLNPGVMFD